MVNKRNACPRRKCLGKSIENLVAMLQGERKPELSNNNTALPCNKPGDILDCRISIRREQKLISSLPRITAQDGIYTSRRILDKGEVFTMRTEKCGKVTRGIAQQIWQLIHHETHRLLLYTIPPDLLGFEHGSGGGAKGSMIKKMQPRLQ